MKTLSFNTLKPLAFTALFVVFAASFNIAAADGCDHCKEELTKCRHDSECRSGVCAFRFGQKICD